MAADRPVIVWFRDDLRLSDHPALAAAARSGRPLVCLYVLDEESPAVRPLGGASRWWLAGSLRALDRALQKQSQRLVLRRGRARQIVSRVAEDVGAEAVCWNRRYDKVGRDIDRDIEETLAGRNVAVETFHANLLAEPGQVRSRAGGSIRVFTPFWRRLNGLGEPRQPIRAPTSLGPARDIAGDRLETWGLEPTKPDWAGGLRAAWTPGEEGAHAQLAAFLEGRLHGYAQERDRPDRDGTSRLSPHLRFGEISPFQVWHATRLATEAPPGERFSQQDADKFLTELGWREFSYHLLHDHPDLATRNLQPRFDRFRWRRDRPALRAWQQGRTGYPIVDAGMRQLWQAGWMHNRVRMVVASFLVKHLLLDWRAGEAWFWDTLVDADPANNPASWQWVAGSGADAAPYFRVFNPVLQGEKFDPRGNYVRTFVPELADVPDKFVHKPWLAPSSGLMFAGTPDYPAPIVDHDTARRRALAAFEETKGGRA